jgi:hypothetical protein
MAPLTTEQLQAVVYTSMKQGKFIYVDKTMTKTGEGEKNLSKVLNDISNDPNVILPKGFGRLVKASAGNLQTQDSINKRSKFGETLEEREKQSMDELKGVFGDIETKYDQLFPPPKAVEQPKPAPTVDANSQQPTTSGMDLFPDTPQQPPPSNVADTLSSLNSPTNKKPTVLSSALTKVQSMMRKKQAKPAPAPVVVQDPLTVALQQAAQIDNTAAQAVVAQEIQDTLKPETALVDSSAVVTQFQPVLHNTGQTTPNVLVELQTLATPGSLPVTPTFQTATSASPTANDVSPVPFNPQSVSPIESALGSPAVSTTGSPAVSTTGSPAPASPTGSTIASPIISTGTVNVAAPIDPLVPQDPTVDSSVDQPVVDQLTPEVASTAPRREPVKYHKFPCKTFFGDILAPDWDLNLEAAVREHELTSSEITFYIDIIIKEHGPDILIESRKSDDKQELVEVMELYFCLQRNMAKGSRAPMAMIPISTLIKERDRLAGVQSQTATAPGTDNPTDPVFNPQPVVNQTVVPITPSEANAAVLKAYNEKQTDMYGRTLESAITESYLEQVKDQVLNHEQPIALPRDFMQLTDKNMTGIHLRFAKKQRRCIKL